MQSRTIAFSAVVDRGFQGQLIHKSTVVVLVYVLLVRYGSHRCRTGDSSDLGRVERYGRCERFEGLEAPSVCSRLESFVELVVELGSVLEAPLYNRALLFAVVWNAGWIDVNSRAQLRSKDATVNNVP